MAYATSRPRKTVADFMALPDDVRAELIDGEIFVTPTPREIHQGVVGRLHLRIGGWLETHPVGRLILSPFDVHLPSGDVVEPDLVYVANSNLGILRGWAFGAPDLLVEVLSPSHPERDLLVKRGVYARNRIPEYWIVDPQTSSIAVLRLDGSSYRADGYFERGSVLESPAFPGFRLALDDVFPAR